MKTKFKKGYYKAISFAIALLMILLSLPTSYVYANEGETSKEAFSEEAQSDSSVPSTPTEPTEPLPEGKDDKEGEDEAKGVVPPPDVPEPTYLEEGVYAIKNVGNSTMYFDTRGDTVYSGGYMQQFAYSALPTTSFARSALFKIKRVSGTQYIVRLMTNNCLTFDISGNNVVTKEITYSNSAVAASDRILISDADGDGVFTISPYGSNVYISAPNSTTSGGSSESSKLITTTSSSSSRAQWTFTKYTGAHKQDMQIIGAESLIAGNTYTLRPAFYSTKIDYNMPVLDMQYANASAFTLTGPTTNGLYTIQIHQTQENMLVGLYVGNGSSRDLVRYDMWDLKLPIENGTYFFNNVELDETYMQIDDNESITQNGAQMELHEFDGENYQRWDILHVSGLYFKIISAASGKALTCPTSLDASVTQTTYTGANNQLWKFTRLSDGTYQITSKLNGRYLAAGYGILTPIGRNVEARNAQSDGKDEWKLTRIQYSATVYNYYDKGYYVRYGETENTSIIKIDSYMDAVAEQYLKLLGLELTTPTAEYYASAIDSCKGTVNSSNIDMLCSHDNSHTILFDNDNPYTVSKHFNANTNPLGSNVITNAYWSGHRIKTYTTVDEYNRCYSSGTSIFMLDLSSSTNRDLYSKGILMHEMNHQYGAKDHYHEIIDEGTSNERCRGGDLCSVCGNNPRPKTCIMNQSRIDITTSNVICNGCKSDLHTHLDEHH